MARALITWGGWDGHQPDVVAALFAGWLREAGMEVDVTDSLSCFDDPARLADLSLIVPVWTMSEIGKEQAENAAATVAAIREEGGVKLVDLTLSTTNQDGKEVMTGNATARIDP